LFDLAGMSCCQVLVSAKASQVQRRVTPKSGPADLVDGGGWR
jgi:hypothetical protein